MENKAANIIITAMLCLTFLAATFTYERVRSEVVRGAIENHRLTLEHKCKAIKHAKKVRRKHKKRRK